MEILIKKKLSEENSNLKKTMSELKPTTNETSSIKADCEKPPIEEKKSLIAKPSGLKPPTASSATSSTSSRIGRACCGNIPLKAGPPPQQDKSEFFFVFFICLIIVEY